VIRARAQANRAVFDKVRASDGRGRDEATRANANANARANG